MNNGTRIVFAAFEERELSFDLAAKYPDFLTLVKVIDEDAVAPEVELITEPAPAEPVVTEKVEEKKEEKEEPKLITEPEEVKVATKRKSRKSSK
jgi:hypothetical protein